MKRLAVVVLIIALITSIGACSSSAPKTAASRDDMAANTSTAAMAKYDGDGMSGSVDVSFSEEMSESRAVAQATGSFGGEADLSSDDRGTSQSTPSSAAHAVLSGRKIIFNGNLTIEVENYNEAYGKIESMIVGIGYIQSSNETRDRIYVGNKETYITRGVIVLRVANDRFHAIMSSAEGLGEILERSSDSQDFTDRYFDTDARLKVLLLEEERLLSYLNKIEDPDTIFKYERRLTEVRQEIESLTGTLRKLDDLVDFSTITINLREKNTLTRNDDTTPYLERLGDKFVDSINRTIYYFGEILIFVIQALPVLVILAVLSFIGYKIFRNHKMKKE